MLLLNNLLVLWYPRGSLPACHPLKIGIVGIPSVTLDFPPTLFGM
jgi:hypothetical protein